MEDVLVRFFHVVAVSYISFLHLGILSELFHIHFYAVNLDPFLFNDFFLFPDFFMYPPRPIWYPDLEFDQSQVEEREGYPDEINVPSKATWGKMERIGEFISVRIAKKKISSKLKFVQMSKNNVLQFNTKNKSITRKLLLLKLFILFPLLKKIWVNLVRLRGGFYEE